METCPRCEKPFVKLNSSHTIPCNRAPKADELALILKNDTAATFPELGKRYGVSRVFISDRLDGTSWTKDKIRKRGWLVRSNIARNGNHERKCVCGIVLEDDEDICMWCVEETVSKELKEDDA